MNVRAVLTGRIVQRGDTLQISAELVDARDNSQLWGGQFNRKVADLFLLQQEIAKEISESLRLKLSPAEEKRLSKRPTENGEAWQLYLQGRYYWNRREKDNLLKSIDYFQQAIAKDARFALAHVGLADAYLVLNDHDVLTTAELFAKAKPAVATKRNMALGD